MIASWRRVPLGLSTALSVAALAGLAGCGSEPPPADPSGSSAPLVAEGTLGPASGPRPARSYQPAGPEGASVRVEFAPTGTSTNATLTVQGLVPNRGYAVHAHTRPCGATGDAAGPHFQNAVDPAATPQQPSVDPDYANPQNEIWLDTRTDATGAGTSSATVPFTFTDRRPMSVIIHEAMTTATAPGQAGTAGGRLACVSVAG